MYIKNKRGQSTVEYVLLVTAVIAVIIAFTAGNNSGVQGQLNSTLNTAVGDIGGEVNALDLSHVQSDSSNGGTPPYTVPVCPPGQTC